MGDIGDVIMFCLLFLVLFIAIAGEIRDKDKSRDNLDNWHKVQIVCDSNKFQALRYKNDWDFKDTENEGSIDIPKTCIIFDRVTESQPTTQKSN